jgi:signal transduction protein with GAF and PtsI domain
MTSTNEGGVRMADMEGPEEREARENLSDALPKVRLSLSGEHPSSDLLAGFDGIGLLRSEFILRKVRAYITLSRAQEALARYVADIAKAVYPAPLWYRTTDLWTDEANVLDGVDVVMAEWNPIVGFRGLRRGLRYPEAFRTEIGLVTEVAQSHPNLHVLFPFVGDADEFGQAVDVLDNCGWPNRFGSMVEVPSAALDVERLVQRGASNLLVGINDLTCLVRGADRGSGFDQKLHPAVWWHIDQLHAIDNRAEWGIGGTLTSEILAAAARNQVPYVTVHYAELPNVLGTDPATLPEIGLVPEIKKETRKLISAVKKWDFESLQQRDNVS